MTAGRPRRWKGASLLWAGIGVIVASGGDAVHADPNTPAAEMRACWLSHYTYVNKTDAQLRAMAQNMRAGGINTVYFAVYAGAKPLWPSKAYQAAGGSWTSSTRDYVAVLTRVFREEGLRVGAWFEYGMALGFSNHPIAYGHPDWLARDRYGDPVTGENGGFVFVSPGCDEAMTMLEGMVRELAENYSFDDIQIDRFRWGRDTTGREYGYEDCTSDLYFAQYGVNPPTNKNNSQWVRFREVLVNNAVQRCYNAIKAANPHIVVSSAPTGAYGVEQHLQRWSDWVQGGYLDLVMPQMYKTSLSAFQTELDTHLAWAAGYEDKLAVGYRASDDDDWTQVASQMQYARSHGVAHDCLWVYHQYTAQIAIQDELDNLPQPGQPWEQPACNPFTNGRVVQVVVDNRDDGYAEGGFGWQTSAQPDFFRFDSRVAAYPTDSPVTYAGVLPIGGRYDVYVWYTAAGNRSPAASYHVEHYNGTNTQAIDQRTGGGQWVSVGRYVFDAGPASVRLTTENATAGQYTSSDAVKFRLSGYALGDADGDGVVAGAEGVAALGCMTGPDGDAGGAACEAFDFDDDQAVDLSDVGRMQVFVNES
jgi:uncharacterized lipoprotein YddW (UPF0748 family)